MSEKKDNGGPAFACADGDTNYPQTGMSLRQWYAGRALTGLIADTHHELDSIAACKVVATAAFALADAMLEAEKS